MNKYETLKSTSELGICNREKTSLWRRDHGEKGQREQVPPTLLRVIVLCPSFAQSWEIKWMLGGRGGLQLPKTEESSHSEKGKPI